MKQEFKNIEKECIFCRIASGKTHAHKVFENDNCVAFLDLSPIREAHCQIIPRQHFETFDSMPSELSAEIVKIGQQLATVMKAIYKVERVAFLFSGSDMPHTHAHVFPMHEKTDVTSARYITEPQKSGFSSDHLRVDSDMLVKVQQKITDQLSEQNVQNATCSAKEVVIAFWKAMETNDFDHAAQFLSEDFEGHWPQSSELIIGRKNFAAINTSYPAHGTWKFTINSIVCEGNQAVTDVSVADGTQNGRAITFHTVHNDKITRQVEFWPDNFEPPAWRAQWVKLVQNRSR